MHQYSIYTGIVIQNNDPDKCGRIKVYIPGVTNSIYDGWNNDNTDKEFSFIDGDLTHILDQLRQDLPWAECAASVFGGDSSKVMIGSTPTDLTQAAGTFSIPNVGSHVYIFFESGNINYPVYLAGAHGGSEWRSVLGDNYPVDGTDTNAHVLNTNKHGFKFVDTSGKEEIKLSHFSGSFIQMLLKDTNTNTVENKTETVGKKYNVAIGEEAIITVGSGSTINIKADGSITINATTSVDITTPKATINGNTEIKGNLKVSGTSTASDHLSSGISGKGHTHKYSLPQHPAGIAPTAPPQ